MKVLEIFEQISKIPRCSRHEELIRDFICDWARIEGFKTTVDNVGNLLVSVPASSAETNGPIIVLQGHMDMVCEKDNDTRHDFSKEPIKLCYEGDWLKASHTTLGADNGAGLAIAMAVSVDKNIKHPALELLFTVDEETGVTGASQLEDDFISGKVLINLDSEDEGVFTIGCAGGRNSELILPFEFDEGDFSGNYFEIKISGLLGGHSGINIDDNRANANKILAGLLNNLNNKTEMRLVEISGGSAHNAIPREAQCCIIIEEKDQEVAREICDFYSEWVRHDYPAETAFSVSFNRSENFAGRIFSRASSLKIINILYLAPHGVMSKSAEVEGLVESSMNFATISQKEDQLVLLFSKRSDKPHKIDAMADHLKALAVMTGAEHRIFKGYPGWQPNLESDILRRAEGIYHEMFSKKPVIEVIHAGLECGIIGAKYQGMDMISMGPTIRNPHSPDEKMHIPSVEKLRSFLAALLESYV